MRLARLWWWTAVRGEDPPLPTNFRHLAPKRLHLKKRLLYFFSISGSICLKKANQAFHVNWRKDETFMRRSDPRTKVLKPSCLFNMRAGAHGLTFASRRLSPEDIAQWDPNVTPKYLKLQIYQIPIMSAERFVSEGVKENRVCK